MNPIREARTGLQDPSNGLRGYGTPPIQRGGRGSHSDTSSGLELDEVEGVKCTPSYPPPFLPRWYICTTADYIRSLFEFSGTLKGKCSRLGFFELTNFLIAQPYQSMLQKGYNHACPRPHHLRAKFSSSGESNFDLEGVKTRTHSRPPPPLQGRSICTTADYIRSLFEFSGSLKGKCSRLGFFELTNFLIAQPYQSMLEKGIIMPAPAPLPVRKI